MDTVLNTAYTMTIQNLIDNLKKTNQLTALVEKFTFIVNEKSETQGALFFIPIESKEYKILIPAPFHTDVLDDKSNPSYYKIVTHKEALLLK